MKSKVRYLLFAAAAVVVMGVFTMSLLQIKVRKDTNKVSLPSIDDVPGEYWSKLAETKIYFGHQSVGYNIIDGIRDILIDHDHIKLNIAETCEPTEFERPIFAHSQVGRNTDPDSKIERFRDVMDAGVGNNVDMAFFKFCYVDIMRDSDPQKIFDRYKAALDDLESRYPQTTFLHVTVPLCSVPKGPKKNLKQFVKRLIGKPGFKHDNVARQSYNTLLRNAYYKTEPFFDLALIETVNPDGFRCYADKGPGRVPVMASEYTDDGGHLNGKGRRRIAEQLLIFLAEEANKLE